MKTVNMVTWAVKNVNTGMWFDGDYLFDEKKYRAEYRARDAAKSVKWEQSSSGDKENSNLCLVKITRKVVVKSNKQEDLKLQVGDVWEWVNQDCANCIKNNVGWKVVVTKQLDNNFVHVLYMGGQSDWHNTDIAGLKLVERNGKAV